MRVTVLSGGVGGARFLRGVVAVAEPEEVTIVGNVGDDLEVLGLSISPDLDSVLYALTGVSDEDRGWGRADESWNALATVSQVGGEDWFRLGDRDLGLHLVRTRLLADGVALSAVTARLGEGFGLRSRLLPATDDPLRTFITTPAGTFPFQEWFVARRHADPVDSIAFRGSGEARPAPGVIDAIESAELLVIAPSNPHVSIGPILAVPGIRAAIEARRTPCVAVSPLIGGRAVKGPADGMLARLAGGTTPAAVAGCYPGLIDVLVVDEADAPADPIDGVRVVVTKTLMVDDDARRRLARTVLDVADGG